MRKISIDKKIPNPSKRMNILGRKQYPGDTNAVDVINYSFDDCWRAIGWLYFLVIALVAVVFYKILDE